MAKKEAKNGLGKAFSELLDDNSEITNMISNVLLHKDDGRSVKEKRKRSFCHQQRHHKTYIKQKT